MGAAVTLTFKRPDNAGLVRDRPQLVGHRGFFGWFWVVVLGGFLGVGGGGWWWFGLF